MSSILDTITGGGLLPHVYCRKVTLENSAAAGKTDVILSLELYQDKNALLSSSWLNNLSTQGMNFLDALCIQVVPFVKLKNIKKLLPSNEPMGELPAAGNVYTAKQQFGDNYLPRGAFGQWAHGAMFAEHANVNKVFDSWAPMPSPIQISNSSVPIMDPNTPFMNLDEFSLPN